MHLVSAKTHFATSPEGMFNHFADHEKFTGIFGGSPKRVKGGEDEPTSLGSVCYVKVLGFEETIAASDRPNAIDYAITKGGPLKNHLGQIRFVPVDGGTRVDDEVRFESKVPPLGYLAAAALKMAYTRGVKKTQSALAGQ